MTFSKIQDFKLLSIVYNYTYSLLGYNKPHFNDFSFILKLQFFLPATRKKESSEN